MDMELNDRKRKRYWSGSNPINFITITKRENKNSKYELNCEALERIVEPIKDIPVVVIPIVGPSRQGKSFMLNYMSRYLSDPKNIDWIGKSDEPLRGFDWKTDIDPHTWGLWLSTPFVIKQSNGKEIAVLLIDTQGVFDEFSDQRDWSTIVGISLLMSSCIIFNVFTSLQEDILMTLESFLQYGLLASKSNAGSEEEKPFQSLMFLIRDWNTPAQFKYGLTGGKQFLDRKLEFKKSQSTTAQTTRRLLYKCFKDVSCFLMPKIGDNIEEEDFTGSVESLNPRFVEKMKEFITHLLNPEELKPKYINNNVITGEELVQYFKTYVQIFNSDELPKPNDIIEATAKTSDFILINKLKDSHLNQLKTFINSKPFIPRKELDTYVKQSKFQKLENFEQKKKSFDKEIVKELYELIESQLNSNFEQIVLENERKREQIISKAIGNCGKDFMDLINAEMDSQFFDSYVLDEMLRTVKKKVLLKFNESFGDEEEDVFAKDSLKLKLFIENSESAFKSQNHRRKAEAEKNNTCAVNESVEFYRQHMKSLLDQNIYLTEANFYSFEKDMKEKAKQCFKQNCIFGDSKFIKTFGLIFHQKLKESKKDFKQQNQIKCDRIVINTEKELINAIEEYKQKLLEKFNSFASEEDVNECHLEVQQNCLEQFKDICVFKDLVFLDKYFKEFEEEINKCLVEFNTKLIDRNEKVNNLYKTRVTEFKDIYINKMEEKMTENEMYSNEEINEFNENIRNELILEFTAIPAPEIIGFDVDIYLSQLKQSIDEELNKYIAKNEMNREFKEKDLELVVNDFLDLYESQMESHIEMSESENELIDKHQEVKEDIINQFKDKNPFPNLSLFEPYLQKLEEKIESSLKDSIDLLELQLKSKESVAKNLTNDVRKYYKEEMDKYYQKTSYLSKDKLLRSNESVLKTTFAKFESERGVMSYEKYTKLIKESIEDIFNKIEAQNDMNTPTLPAIGIDLGTTNSCVAFFKPDRKNGNTVNVIPNELGYNVTPSVVSIRDNKEVVGNLAKKEINVFPYNTIYSAKRLIGRQFNDNLVQNDIKNYTYNVIDDGFNNPKISVRVNGSEETYFAEQISAKVLIKMREIAEKHLNTKVTKAVITVPAYFNDSQKEATKDAGKLAGLEVLKIINEPTAAAIAFKVDRNDDMDSRKVLIYDFGGGTFDVAVLVIDRGNIEIKAVGGDNHLGGDDIDYNIVDYCLKEFRTQTGITVSATVGTGAEAINRLRVICEEHKCNLSSIESTVITIDDFYQNQDLRVDMTRDILEQINNDLFMKSMDLVAQALEDAAITHSDINDIVLVGGTTRIPKIQELLSDQFSGRPLNHSVHPDEAVAVGAAIQAAILNGQQAQGLGHLKVSDVAPMSLGVKVVKGSIKGLMSTIIARNSKVPNTYEKTFETVSDFQTSVDVEIFEGEEDMADNNRLLGKFELKGIPSAPKGEPIKVTFEVTDEGILRVNAKSINTGGEEEIEIKEHKGRLSDQELEQLIQQGN